jgi:hypothetical protein
MRIGVFFSLGEFGCEFAGQFAPHFGDHVGRRAH